MAQPKKSRVTKKKSSLKRNVLYTLLILVIVIAVGIYYKVHTNHIKQDKQAAADKILLDKVDQRMRIVYDKIVADVGKPDYVNIEKACTYPNLKFEKGKPSCGPNYLLVYGAQERESMISLVENIRLAANSSGITILKPTDSVNDFSYGGNHYTDYLYPSKILGVSCLVYAQGGEKTDYTLENYAKNISTPLVLTVSYHCTKLESKPLYP